MQLYLFEVKIKHKNDLVGQKNYIVGQKNIEGMVIGNNNKLPLNRISFSTVMQLWS